MKGNLNSEQLRELISHQKQCKETPPITERATFKLDELKALIAEIENSEAYQKEPDSNTKHSICVAFVREEWGSKNLLYNSHKPMSDASGRFSQIIPIILGCECKLEEKNYTPVSFHVFKNTYGIPFVRPGGEGTGLIPPPPPNDKDDI